MTINPDLTRLRKEIDRILAEKRPDRYVVRDSGIMTEADSLIPDVDGLFDEDTEPEDSSETAWLDDVAEEVANLVPDEEIRKLYARKIVGEREGNATRRANRLLRKIGRTGQLVLGWWGQENDPVSVKNRIVVPGKQVRIKEERVALRAMLSADFRRFAAEERRRAAGDFAARNDTCTGAEWLAERLEQTGAVNFHAWAIEELPPPLPCDDDEQADG